MVRAACQQFDRLPRCGFCLQALPAELAAAVGPLVSAPLTGQIALDRRCPCLRPSGVAGSRKPASMRLFRLCIPGRYRALSETDLCRHTSSAQSRITRNACASASSSSRPYLGALFCAAACSSSNPYQLACSASTERFHGHSFLSYTRYFTARGNPPWWQRGSVHVDKRQLRSALSNVLCLLSAAGTRQLTYGRGQTRPERGTTLVQLRDAARQANLAECKTLCRMFQTLQTAWVAQFWARPICLCRLAAQNIAVRKSGRCVAAGKLYGLGGQGPPAAKRSLPHMAIPASPVGA